MDYLKITIPFHSPIEKEKIIAFAAEGPFNGLIENMHSLDLFISEQEATIWQLDKKMQEYFPFSSFEIEKIESRNWNEEWEKNYSPVKIGKLYIRAPFHPPSTDYFNIVIEPNNAFGTGHHETTAMMCEMMQEMKKLSSFHVLDVGCGTGLLSILAEKMDACAITGIDNDPSAIKSAIKNAEINECKRIHFYVADASVALEGSFHLIVANINRNVLIKESATLTKKLINGGTLLISGFYIFDKGMLTETYESLGMKCVEQKEKNQWCALKFRKE